MAHTTDTALDEALDLEGLTAFCPKFHHAVELVGRRWTGAIPRAMFAVSAVPASGWTGSATNSLLAMRHHQFTQHIMRQNVMRMQQELARD